MADTVHTPAQGKPYFSLAMKKITGSAITEVNEAVASLTDTSILADTIHEDPLTITTTITVETSNNDDILDDSKTANISSTPPVSIKSDYDEDANRAVRIDSVDPADVALLTAMWACFALAFFAPASVCAVFGCRRNLSKKQHRVQASFDPRSKSDTNNTGANGAKTHTFGDDDRHDDSRDLDDEGLNAFNTEDVLKQRDNPTNPIRFSARSNNFNDKEQLNTSRPLTAGERDLT